MQSERNNVELTGILSSDLYFYPEIKCGDQICGLFTIMVGADANSDLSGYLEETDLTVPIHVWSTEILNYLKIRIKKGRPIAIHGKINMFGDRLLISVSNKDDISFLHSSVQQLIVRQQRANENCQRLALACVVEDHLMLNLSTSGREKNSEEGGWVCEK